MKLNFSSLKLKDDALSTAPMSFSDPDFLKALVGIMNLIGVETAPRDVLVKWQEAQIRNLLRHVVARSPFWRARLQTTAREPALSLCDIPILTRLELARQVSEEGALLGLADKIKVFQHGTSGSSGNPVKFFVSQINGSYNGLRSVAQYFMEGRDLSLNRTRMRTLSYKQAQEVKGGLPLGFQYRTTPSWIGPFSKFVNTGKQRDISYLNPNPERLVAEMCREPMGYLVVQPRLLESFRRNGVLERLVEGEIAMVIALTEGIDDKLREIFIRRGIPVRCNYSSEEVGLIASECELSVGYYHVASSNVIVERGETVPTLPNSAPLSRVLVTHLHSYASPIIRYDLGDCASFHDSCPCGHHGLTLSNISGRSKNLILHADGSVAPFSPKASDLSMLDFDEFRIRQVTTDHLIVEIAGCKNFTEERRAALVQLLKGLAGQEFMIDILLVGAIEWGAGVKRLAFCNEIIM